MITESKVTEIFCIADDFCKEFEGEMAKNALPSTTDTPKRKRKRMMSDAEVITILICFHFNSYRNFKHYYLGCVRIHWKSVSADILLQPLRGGHAPMFCGYDHVPAARVFRRVHGDKFCGQHLHSGHTQQTPVQHEGIQGYCCQREEYDGMVCRLQTASAM